jgi:hypothetical protein
MQGCIYLGREQHKRGRSPSGYVEVLLGTYQVYPVYYMLQS